MKPQRLLIDVSWRALLKVVILAIALVLAYKLLDVLVMLLVVFIFVAAVTPTVSRMQGYMSRTLAVIFFYVLLAAVLALISYFLVPTLVTQLNSLSQSVPELYHHLLPYYQNYQHGHADLVSRLSSDLASSLQHLSTNLV